MWQGRGKKRKKRACGVIVFPWELFVFLTILFLVTIYLPKNLHHLPFIKTTSKWGKKGHGSLRRGAKKGGRRRGEDRRRGPRPPLPSRIAIQTTRAGTEPHVRGRRMEDGALNRASAGHRPPSAVRSRVRPTPSRGASPKICSLEPPPSTSSPRCPATRPIATSGGIEEINSLSLTQSRPPHALGKSRSLGPPAATTARAAAPGAPAPPPPDSGGTGATAAAEVIVASRRPAPLMWRGRQLLSTNQGGLENIISFEMMKSSRIQKRTAKNVTNSQL